MTKAARLRITLLDLDPAPWREIEVPLSISFKNLHDAIQAAFLWEDCHLWEFEFAGRRYGPHADDGFGDNIYKATAARLKDAAGEPFLYTYDMGDDWEHQIDVLEVFTAEPKTPLPRYCGGEWRAPPEDVGGAPGFEMFLEALADPSHPDHEHLSEWHGEPFDPKDLQEDVIRARFAGLAKPRPR